MTEDVVVYKIEGTKIESWGRDNAKVAQDFCASPKWPAKPHEVFIGVDDWGAGNIVAAHRDLKGWLGKPVRQFKINRGQ